MASRLLSLARRRWVQVLVGVLLVFRMVLPEIVRRIAERQASDTLHARVHIGDVGLALLRAGVTLEDPDALVVIVVVRLVVGVRWIGPDEARKAFRAETRADLRLGGARGVHPGEAL